jgi:arsenate reductase
MDLIKRVSVPVRDVLRRKDTPYDALGLGPSSLSDDALINGMTADPILSYRPIVVTDQDVRLCRPSEVVLGVLPQPQRGRFAEEDGEAVIDAHDNRIARLTP